MESHPEVSLSTNITEILVSEAGECLWCQQALLGSLPPAPLSAIERSLSQGNYLGDELCGLGVTMQSKDSYSFLWDQSPLWIFLSCWSFLVTPWKVSVLLSSMESGEIFIFENGCWLEPPNSPSCWSHFHSNLFSISIVSKCLASIKWLNVWNADSVNFLSLFHHLFHLHQH